MPQMTFNITVGNATRTGEMFINYPPEKWIYERVVREHPEYTDLQKLQECIRIKIMNLVKLYEDELAIKAVNTPEDNTLLT